MSRQCLHTAKDEREDLRLLADGYTLPRPNFAAACDRQETKFAPAACTTNNIK